MNLDQGDWGQSNPGQSNPGQNNRGQSSRGQISRSDINSLEALLHQLKEQRRREARGLTGLESFLPVRGELPLDTSLELALLTLAHYRYRGIPQWRVQQTYSFTCDGIFQRTYVEAWDAGDPVRFTPEEAIVIARHVSQQDGDW